MKVLQPCNPDCSTDHLCLQAVFDREIGCAPVDMINMKVKYPKRKVLADETADVFPSRRCRNWGEGIETTTEAPLKANLLYETQNPLWTILQKRPNRIDRAGERKVLLVEEITGLVIELAVDK